APVLAGWAWQAERGSGREPRRALRSALLVGAGVFLAIAPVTLRNWAVGGDLVPISHNAGVNFYLGNNPDYERTVGIRPGKEWAWLVEMPEREAGLQRPSAKSSYFFARALDYITSDPVEYARLLLYKTYLFWRGDEIRRNLDLYVARQDSRLLWVLLWKHGLAFPFGLVAPLALVGLFAFWRSPVGRTVEGRLLLLFVLTHMVSVVLFFVTSRYRLPAVPLLLLFAAWGARSALAPGRRLVAGVSLGALLLVANAGAGAMDPEPEPQHHFWLGWAYEQQGMRAQAMREYRAALRGSPDHENALLRLGALYSAQQQHYAAMEVYRRFLQHYPASERARFLLANAHLQVEQYGQAIAVYEELLPLRPDWAELHGRLGYAHLMAGHPAQAAAAYRRTLELNPDSSLVRYQLARLYEEEGDFARALAEYGQLLAAEPQRAELHLRLAEALIGQEGAGRPSIILGETAGTRRAEEHLRLAEGLDPDLVLTQWSLGLLLARQSRYPEAVVHFERVAQLAPLDDQVHACLGNLYERLGRPQEAQEEFARQARLTREARLQTRAQSEMRGQLAQVQELLKLLAREDRP
ncbi:MAG: tetratricopeptide repeat protein, partial [Candidatus Latescibacterota bacterium]